MTRVLGERSIEHAQDVYVCFVDYEKAFDRVNWTKLMTIFKEIGVDWRDRRLIATLYMGQTAYVRVDGSLTDAAIIGRGTRQGCLFSPLLFNIYSESMIREAFTHMHHGIKVGGQLVKSIRYADYQEIVANTVQDLQRMMNSMNNVVEEYGMKMNIMKTKTMKIGKNMVEKFSITIKG